MAMTVAEYQQAEKELASLGAKFDALQSIVDKGVPAMRGVYGLDQPEAQPPIAEPQQTPQMMSAHEQVGTPNVNPFQDNFTPSTNVKSMQEIAGQIAPQIDQPLGERLARGAMNLPVGMAAMAEQATSDPAGFAKGTAEYADTWMKRLNPNLMSPEAMVGRAEFGQQLATDPVGTGLDALGVAGTALGLPSLGGKIKGFKSIKEARAAIKDIGKPKVDVPEVVQEPIRSETPIEQPTTATEVVAKAKPNAVTKDVKTLTPEELTAAQARLREKFKPMDEVTKPQTPQAITEDLSQRAGKISTEQPTATVQDAGATPAQSTNPVGDKVTPSAKAKEPWEMTQDELLSLNKTQEEMIATGGDWKSFTDRMMRTGAPRVAHREYIDSALKNGKLTVEQARELGHFDTYPDLAAKYGKPTTAEAVVKKAGEKKVKPPKDPITAELKTGIDEAIADWHKGFEKEYGVPFGEGSKQMQDYNANNWGAPERLEFRQGNGTYKIKNSLFALEEFKKNLGGVKGSPTAKNVPLWLQRAKEGQDTNVYVGESPFKFKKDITDKVISGDNYDYAVKELKDAKDSYERAHAIEYKLDNGEITVKKAIEELEPGSGYRLTSRNNVYEYVRNVRERFNRAEEKLKQYEDTKALVQAGEPPLKETVKFVKGGIELHAGVNPFKIIDETLGQTDFGRNVKNAVTGAKNRIKSPEGKAVIEKMYDTYAETGVRAGKKSEELRNLMPDIKKFTDDEGAHIRDLIEGRPTAERANSTIDPRNPKYAEAAKSLSLFLKRLHSEARYSVGMKIGEVENYFPRMMKPDIIKSMSDGLDAFYRKLDESIDVNEFATMSDEILTKHIADNINRYGTKFDGVTKEAIDHITSQGGDLPSFLMQMRRVLYDDNPLVVFGNLEKSRKLLLPSHFYETNLSKVMGRYIQGWAKRTAETKAFGQNMERLRSEIGKLENVTDADELLKIANYFTGKAQQKHMTSTFYRNLTRRFTNFEVMSKIGTGYATLLQTTQPFISFLKEAGYIRGAKAGMKFISDPAFRKAVRESGAPMYGDAVAAFTGDVSHGTSGKATNLITQITGFQPTNKILQYASASVGKVFIDDLHRIYNTTKIPFRKAWAEAKLKGLGIDNPSKELTDTARLKGMYRFAMDSQLQHNILRDPLWMNDPRTRVFSLFKRFGFRQAQYLKDKMIGEDLRHGNVLPTLRLIAGSYAGVEFADWAKDTIKEVLSGDKQLDNKDADTLDKALTAMSQLGSLGLFSNMFETDEVEPTRKWEDRLEKLGFAVEPVVLAELRKAGEYMFGQGMKKSLWTEFVDKSNKEGTGAAVSGAVNRVARDVSPLGGQIAARFKTEKAKDKTMDIRRGFQIRKIAYLQLNDDRDKAAAMITEWNDTYPEYRIKGEDLKKSRSRILKEESEE